MTRRYDVDDDDLRREIVRAANAVLAVSDAPVRRATETEVAFICSAFSVERDDLPNLAPTPSI